MSSRFGRPGCLATVTVLSLLACSPLKETSPDYLPPQMEMEDLVSYYPLEAYLKGIEGRTVVLARVGETGIVSDVRITVSSGEAILDSAAQVIARVIRFTPAQVHGQPQALWLRVPIVFALDQVDQSSLDLKAWRRIANDLQSVGFAGELEEQRVAQRELLMHYVNLANKTINSRSVAANRTILEVAQAPVQEVWKDYQLLWPLPFALFHDFLVRYPQGEYVGLAEHYFRDYARYEAELIRKTPPYGLTAKEQQNKLLDAISSYLERDY